MTCDELYGEFRRCEAKYPTGQCEQKGHVQVLSRDWSTNTTERLSLCFDCAYAAVQDGIFEVDLTCDS